MEQWLSQESNVHWEDKTHTTSSAAQEQCEKIIITPPPGSTDIEGAKRNI